MNIKVDGSSAARIKVTIEGQDKIALIDAGAGRCCMNEEHYQTLGSPPLEPAEASFKLRTASGALIPGMGFLTCDMQIGTGRPRLIQSHSSARFCFELSGNSN